MVTGVAETRFPAGYSSVQTASFSPFRRIICKSLHKSQRRVEEMVDNEGKADFVRGEGVFFIAHLLRRLSDEIVQGCDAWYAALDWRAPPRTASALHLLYRRGPQSVTDIAGALRQSHPLAVQWTQQLAERGMVKAVKDAADRRRTIISLTPRGKAQVERMLAARPQFEAAYRALAGEADADVFESLWRLEAALRHKGFGQRLAEAAAPKGKHPVARSARNESAGSTAGIRRASRAMGSS